MDSLDYRHFLPDRPALRLCIVSDSFPPEVHPETAALTPIAEHLRRRGHTLEVVHPRIADGDSVPAPGRYARFKQILHYRRLLLARWSRQRPDLVHIDTLGPLGWAALQAAGKLRVPVTASFPGEFAGLPPRQWQKPLAMQLRKFFQRAKAVLFAGHGALNASAGSLRTLHAVASPTDIAGIESALLAAMR